MNENREYCKRIADELEAIYNGETEADFFDYIADALDIEYRVGSEKEYRSARIMVAYGGPNVFIDTKNQLVQLYWWTEYAEYPLAYGVASWIDEYMEELYNC